MSALGLCEHNNPGYCPSCMYEKNRNMSGMGACPAGTYDLQAFGVDTGQCVPSLTSVATQAGVIPSAPVATAPVASGLNLTSAIAYAKANPMIAIGAVVGLFLLL